MIAMSTKQRLVLFLYNDHLRTEMVLEEVFSPSLCSSDQSWSKDSGWGEILKFFENILKHKTKKYFWTSPDVENTRRYDEEAGESWPGILWSGRNPRSGRLRPPPRYCSMALDQVYVYTDQILYILLFYIFFWSGGSPYVQVNFILPLVNARWL